MLTYFSKLRLSAAALSRTSSKYRRHSDGHYCDEQLDRASPGTTILFRRRSYAPLTQTCTAGVCARSCKSRRAPRPRKLDEALSRHGRRARRVAFLSPRAMFSLYCSPLDYLYARFKHYQKDEKHIPHFRRTTLFPSGGGIPEGKEGEQYFHVRGRTPVPTSEPAATSERVLHEFTYNSETNGDGP